MLNFLIFFLACAVVAYACVALRDAPYGIDPWDDHFRPSKRPPRERELSCLDEDDELEDLSAHETIPILSQNSVPLRFGRSDQRTAAARKTQVIIHARHRNPEGIRDTVARRQRGG